MFEWTAEFLQQLVDHTPEAILVCEVHEAGWPLVFANAAAARLLGCNAAELAGIDLRQLQGTDPDLEGSQRLREALLHGESCRITLRSQRRDGSGFWNDLVLTPRRDAAGRLTHFVALCREPGERDAIPLVQPLSNLPSWLREDRLTGLCTRAYFEELLRHDWIVAQREGRTLTLMLFDIDEFGLYNDTFGRAAGDACIRRVAAVVGASFRRGSDVIGRWEGGCIAALVRNPEHTGIMAFGASIQQRVIGQRIHHPRARRNRFVSVSIGVASLSPAGDRQPQQLLAAAYSALQRARHGDAPSTVAVATPDELQENP